MDQKHLTLKVRNSAYRKVVSGPTSFSNVSTPHAQPPAGGASANLKVASAPRFMQSLVLPRTACQNQNISKQILPQTALPGHETVHALTCSLHVAGPLTGGFVSLQGSAGPSLGCDGPAFWLSLNRHRLAARV